MKGSFLIGCVVLSWVIVPEARVLAQLESSAESIAAEMATRRLGGQGVDEQMLSKLRSTRGGDQALIRMARSEDARYRLAATQLLVLYDDRLDRRQNSVSAVPRFRNEEVSAHLVAALDDPDPEVRRISALAVASSVPDSVIRKHEDQVVAAAERYDIDDISLILGCTGGSRARKILKANPKFRQCNKRQVDLALAKLGDGSLEKGFIEEFNAARTPKGAVEAAQALGYIGTRQCAWTLARAMRTPVVYSTPAGIRVSLRVYIIQALSEIYPDEEVLWRPLRRIQSDEYYETIEHWCQTMFSIEWRQPRPPFLYETEAPIPGRIGTSPSE